MFARKGVFSSTGRAGAVAAVVAIALTAVQPSMAFAGSAAVNGVTATTGTSGATDFSARRYYRGRGAAAVGTGIATQGRGAGYYVAPPSYYGGGYGGYGRHSYGGYTNPIY